MKTTFYTALGLLVFLAVITGIGFYGTALDTFLYGWQSPRVEQIRNNTFHNSQAYNDGMISDLEAFRLQYNDPNATDQQKALIRLTVRQRYASYDATRLSPDLQSFLSQMGL